jgi:hypothetical protein
MNIHTVEILADAADPAPQLPAIKSKIQDIVAARDASLEAITRAAETMGAAYDLTRTANSFAAQAHCGRKYWGLDRSGSKSYQALFPDDFDAAASVETYRRQLDAAVWSHLLELTASAK